MLSTSVTTYRYDSSSSGVNASETQLTPKNVNTTTFGKSYSVPLDGQVYAEPLVVAGVAIKAGVNTTAGSIGTHDVVYVATENDSLYAISTGVRGGQVLWKRSFITTANTGGNINNTLGATAVTTVSSVDVKTQDLNPQIGITGTPVIDRVTGVLYVVTKTEETVAGVNYYVQRLHAIKLTDGTDFTAPYLLGTTTGANTNQTQIYAYGVGQGHVTDPYNGTGKQVVQFNALREAQRTALSLVGGRVYISWASHGDNGPYHGWIATLEVTALATTGFKLNGVFCTSPNNAEAGIWEGGGALAFEPDNSAFYFMTGNGNGGAPTLDASGFPVNNNYNEALVKAQLDSTTTQTKQGTNGWGIRAVDYFTPYNLVQMDSVDSDFGSGGPLLLPSSAGIPGHPDLLIAGGKDGRVYVLDRRNLGHFNPAGDTKALNSVLNASGQLTPVKSINGTLSTPTFYNGKLFLVAGYLHDAKAFTLSSTGQLVPASQTAKSYLGFLPGGTTVSSQGTSDGIVWMVDGSSQEVHAYDATSLSTELWNSNQVPADKLSGALVKFAEPTVANGQIFVGTSDSLDVYGLSKLAATVPTAPALAATALSGSSINLTWTDKSVSPSTAGVYSIQESVNGGAYTQVATAPAGATSIAIGGLQSLTKYSFRIAGANSFGSSAFSNIATATTSNQSAGIDFAGGFAGATTLQLNGHAAVTGASLVLTDNKTDEASSAFYKTLVGVNSFTTQFKFQTSANANSADGFTFTMQNSAPTAIGGVGGSLGFGPSTASSTSGIQHSVSIKVDLFGNSGEGSNSTGLYLNGAYPAKTNSIDLTAAGINFHSGDPFQMSLAYDGKTLSEILTDLKTAKSVTETYTVNIPAILGGSAGYVGFTAATGGGTATQSILGFTYSPSASTSPNAPLGLGATPDTATSVNLVWTNTATNQTGYLLDRATDAGFTQNLITETLPADPASAVDSAAGILPGSTYYYRIRAFNSAGPSATSNVASVTIPVAPEKPTDQKITLVSSNEIDFSWQDNAGHSANEYQILRSTNLGDFAVIADLPPTSRTAPSVYAWQDTTVTPGNFYEYHIEAVNSSGHNDFAGLNATTPPAGWSDSDIGSPDLTGSATVTAGTWTVAGSGKDIWNTSDQFNFAYRTLGGNGSIVADVLSQTNTDASAKAGIMIRATTDEDAPFVDLFVMPGNKLCLQWRNIAGGVCGSTTSVVQTLPRYVKLTRSGSSFTGFYSTNGTAWTQIGTAQKPVMGTSALAGLAVTSHDATKTSMATFSNVTIGS